MIALAVIGALVLAIVLAKGLTSIVESYNNRSSVTYVDVQAIDSDGNTYTKVKEVKL